MKDCKDISQLPNCILLNTWWHERKRKLLWRTAAIFHPVRYRRSHFIHLSALWNLHTTPRLIFNHVFLLQYKPSMWHIGIFPSFDLFNVQSHDITMAKIYCRNLSSCSYKGVSLGFPRAELHIKCNLPALVRWSCWSKPADFNQICPPPDSPDKINFPSQMEMNAFLRVCIHVYSRIFRHISVFSVCNLNDFGRKCSFIHGYFYVKHIHIKGVGGGP